MKSFRIFAVCLAVFAVSAPAPAQLKKSSDVVKVEATATKPDAEGNQVVTVVIDVEKPWHIYANPVGNDMLTGAQTSIRFPKAEDVKFTYPEGKVIKDAMTGDYRTYEGKVTIKANVRRTKGDTGPLEFTLKLQACDEKTCLLPATIKMSIP